MHVYTLLFIGRVKRLNTRRSTAGRTMGSEADRRSTVYTIRRKAEEGADATDTSTVYFRRERMVKVCWKTRRRRYQAGDRAPRWSFTDGKGVRQMLWSVRESQGEGSC